MAYPPITSLGTVPQRTQTPAEFATNADSFLGALPNFRTELNTFGAYVDSSGAEIEADKAAAQASATASANSASASEGWAALSLAYKDLALGVANFKGNWSALTGALSVPASVYHNSLTWVLLSNLANVAASEPSNGSTWAVASGESFSRYVDSLFSRAVLDFDFARNKYFAYEQYGLEPKQLTSVLQTLRASTDTYTGPFNVQSVGADAPSIEYNDNTGEPLGLNVRPTSTNLLLHSQYTAASGDTPPTGWADSGGLDTGVATTATSTRFATAIRLTATGSAQREAIKQSVTLAASTTYTFSCYFAQGTSADGTVLRVGSTESPTGTLTLAGSAVTSAGVYSITFTTVAGGSYTFYIGLGCNGEATGTVIHETPQLEVGSFYTGYIPTTTAQVTRTVTQVRRDMGSNFNLAGGVLYVEFIAQAFGNLERLIAIGDTNTTNECSINYGTGPTSNKITGVIRASGVNSNLTPSFSFTAGQLCKAALRYVRNSSGTYSWAFAISGGAPTAAVTTSALPSGYEKLAVGCRHYNSATLQSYTPIKRAVYLGGVFTNAEMQALTA